MNDYKATIFFRLVERIAILRRIFERLGIKFKLISTFLLTLLLIFFLFAFIALKLEENNLKTTTDVLCKAISNQLVSSTLAAMATIKNNTKKRTILQENLDSLKKQKIHGLLSASIIDLSGNVAGLKNRYAAHIDKYYEGGWIGKKKFLELVKHDFSGRFEKKYRKKGRWIDLIVYYTSFSLYDTRHGTIEVSFSKDAIMEPLNRARLLFIWLTLGSIFFIIPIIYFVGTRITKPVRYISEKADYASKGDLDVKIERHTHDEIGNLTLNISRMLQSIKKQQKALIEKERMEEELKIAKDIQQTLLPRELPSLSNMSFHSFFKPHSEASGDYYDFIHIDENNVGIIIADVSGHGVGAGLVMAMTRAVLRSNIRIEKSPEKLLRLVNPTIHEDTLSSMFVTMFYGLVNIDKMVMKYSVAGHNPGILYNRDKKTIKILKTGGIPLGAASSNTFDGLIKLNSVNLDKGDIFLQYTDGVTEAQNLNGEEYGDERLVEAIKNSKAGNSEDLIKYIIQHLDIYVGKAKFHDDITLISFTVN